jgi:hypothetical protein
MLAEEVAQKWQVQHHWLQSPTCEHEAVAHVIPVPLGLESCPTQMEALVFLLTGRLLQVTIHLVSEIGQFLHASQVLESG